MISSVNMSNLTPTTSETLLREAAEKEGFKVGKILSKPIDALCEYHKGEA